MIFQALVESTPAFACEPMVQLVMVAGGPGWSIGPFTLPIAIAIKCAAFPFLQRDLKKFDAARAMFEGNIWTSILGLGAIFPAAAPAAFMVTIWGVLALSYVPARRLSVVLKEARGFRLSPLFIALLMTALYFGSALLIAASWGAAADGKFATFWGLKILAMTTGVGFGIAFSSLWEEWVISKRVVFSGEPKSFLVPVFRSNALAFLIIMGVMAALALPQRLRNPNFLLQAVFGRPAYAGSSAKEAASEPALESGDIVFQTSSSGQSWAIMWASKSLYSHTGVVEVADGKPFVIEAIATVSRTPFEKWKERGRFGRYAVFRLPDLDKAKRDKIIAKAKGLLGRKYNIFFSSKTDEIYCSELVELAYQGAGLNLGKFEKVKDLDVDNFLVRKLVEKRWKKHPLCKDRVPDFDSCWKLIREDELVTPVSIANDTRLKLIWSNYP